MKRFLIVLVFLFLGLLATECIAQNGWYYHSYAGWHYHGAPAITYRPVVAWYPSGTWMNVGPVHVSPNRKYVRFGINVGFSQYRGYSTFNFRTGETRYYPHRR